MKKDIEIPIVKDVAIALAQEWDETFSGKDWNAYIINHKTTAIDMVLVVSKGYDDDRKTSTMRHSLGTLAAKSCAKIELVPDDVLQLNNVFYVTFFAGDKLYEKNYIFKKNSVLENNMTFIPILEKEGILVE
ncbi:hypothetical protein MWU65_09910 [Cellulophaga sp. F20128]|uniref:hypothetical protein n=1 Tax=Cellulophaga sp. F20128 TaxID=2926413 RepID=UPI001FF5801F|nr:hypothetical protein [Cellulophaga sp. F20128]MCK0157493.1 hypothetical protein [Cellulophaga sp. F20128]